MRTAQREAKKLADKAWPPINRTGLGSCRHLGNVAMRDGFLAGFDYAVKLLRSDEFKESARAQQLATGKRPMLGTIAEWLKGMRNG